MSVSLRSRGGAVILFDFKAAFPTLSIEFLMAALEMIGMPTAARRMVLALYHDQTCRISLAGTTFDGFPVTSGIR